MSLLEKIADSQRQNLPVVGASAVDHPAQASADPAPAVALFPPPRERCRVCQPPAGRHFWLDVYGEWTCTTCCGPASLAQVRAEHLVPLLDKEVPDADGPDQWEPALGFRIVAIFNSDGLRFFDPNATQAERREAIETVEWFDRQDKHRQTVRN